MNGLTRSLLASWLGLSLAACSDGPHVAIAPPQLAMDKIAEGYVRQVFALAEHDPEYVEAYYGPPEWRDSEVRQKRSLLAILNLNARLQNDIDTAPVDPNTPPELWDLRKRFLHNQLGALEARTRMLQDWKPGFDDESLALYDASAPFYGHEDFKPMLDGLDALLPAGEGSISQRYNRYMEQFAIPSAKIDASLQLAVDVARQRTRQFFRLPADERLEIKLVSGKSWRVKSRYAGAYVSRVEINTDQPILIWDAIDFAAREGYPGHHVYQVLLEDQLVKGHGWKEFTVFPRYSPQSFISEATAAFGVQLEFDAEPRRELERQMFELNGMDPTEVDRYDTIVQAALPRRNAIIEAARRYRDGQASPDETVEWLEKYALQTPRQAQEQLAAFDQTGAYVINAGAGAEVIRGYLDRTVGESEPEWAQWRGFFDLLTTPHTPTALMPE